MNKCLVLGLGNILCGDDGAGCRAAEYLHALKQFPDEVEIIDGGTLGQELLDPIARADTMLVLDCVDFDLEPGSIHIQREIPIWLGARKMSPHQGSFSEILALADLKNSLPAQIILVGIQPCGMAFGDSLSGVVRDKIPLLAHKAVDILAELGIAGVTRREKSFLSLSPTAFQNCEPDLASRLAMELGIPNP